MSYTMCNHMNEYLFASTDACCVFNVHSYMRHVTLCLQLSLPLVKLRLGNRDGPLIGCLGYWKARKSTRELWVLERMLEVCLLRRKADI